MTAIDWIALVLFVAIGGLSFWAGNLNGYRNCNRMWAQEALPWDTVNEAATTVTEVVDEVPPAVPLAPTALMPTVVDLDVTQVIVMPQANFVPRDRVTVAPTVELSPLALRRTPLATRPVAWQRPATVATLADGGPGHPPMQVITTLPRILPSPLLAAYETPTGRPGRHRLEDRRRGPVTEEFDRMTRDIEREAAYA